MSKKPQAIVIGLDGGTLNLMEDWMDEGKLPNFNIMRKNGAYGELNSTIPPYSAQAWTSIVTGCQPGKHGIYDFFVTSTISKKLINSKYRKTPAIWNYLTDAGKKNIVVAVPGTYPPEKINGVMITGLLTPSPKSEYTFPRELKRDLIDGKIGEYILEQVAVDDIPKYLYARHDPQKLVEKINRMTESHSNVTSNLMNKYDWDFSMYVIRGTDDAQHLLWNKKEYILSCYEKADEYVGKMMKSFPDALFIIVSDHGFDTPGKYIYLNNFLFNNGYLKTKSDPRYSSENIMLFFFDKISNLIFRLFPMEKLVRTSIGRKLIISKGPSANIDLSLTKAVYHSVCSRGIRIMLKDKYKDGIVDRKDYERLREELIKLLKEIKDPETGEFVIRNIYRWEEVYDKDAVNDPLDIIIEPKQGYSTQELIRQPYGLGSQSNSDGQPLSIIGAPGFYDWIGDHKPEGIIFLYGNNVEKNKKIEASVIDIVPTVLGYLGVPIPDIIDGKLISDAFVKKIKTTKITWKKEKTIEKPLLNSEMAKIRELKKKF